MDVYLPALPGLAADFGVSQSVAAVTISTFLAGIAVGQLVAGPISDLLGRRAPLLASLALFAAASLVCAAAPGVASLAVARFFQGFCAAGGIVIARAMVRDVYDGAAAARALSRILMVYGLAPVLAPLIGAGLLLVTDWRGVFLLLLIFATVLLLAAALLLPETLPPERRRVSVAHLPPDFRLLLGDRGFLGYVAAIGLASAALLSYISASSFVIQDHFGASVQGFGAIYGLCGVALVVASNLNAHLLARFGPRSLLGSAVAGFVGAGAALVALIGIGAPLWALTPFFAGLFFGWGFLLPNAVALALADHPRQAGSASGLLGLAQFGVASIVAPLVGVGGEHAALPMALAIFLASGLAALSLRYLAPAPIGRDLELPG